MVTEPSHSQPLLCERIALEYNVRRCVNQFKRLVKSYLSNKAFNLWSSKKHISYILFLFHFIHIFIRPSASWAIDSEPIRAWGTIILVKSI